jgi:hypothetical protein
MTIPEMRFDPAEEAQLAALVRHSAAELSALLGYTKDGGQ